MAPVLVAYGSKHGSTAEIARAIGEALRGEGYDVVVADAHDVQEVERFGAIIVGSALYMTRWRREPVKLLRRFREHLRRRPVWLFHSGPLDRDEDHAVQGLPSNVQKLAADIGVKETMTFGGKLDADAGGILEHKMAETMSGDYRDFDEIAAWGRKIAGELASITAA